MDDVERAVDDGVNTFKALTRVGGLWWFAVVCGGLRWFVVVSESLW